MNEGINLKRPKRR